MYFKFIEAMRVRGEKLAQVTQCAVSDSPISATGFAGSGVAEALSPAEESRKSIFQSQYSERFGYFRNLCRRMGLTSRLITQHGSTVHIPQQDTVVTTVFFHGHRQHVRLLMAPGYGVA